MHVFSLNFMHGYDFWSGVENMAARMTMTGTKQNILSVLRAAFSQQLILF